MGKNRYHYLKKARQSVWKYRTKMANISMALMLTVFSYMLQGARAVSDTTAPTISSFSLAQSTLEANSNGGGIYVNANIADDISGVFYADILYTSPSGKQVGTGNFWVQNSFIGNYDGIVNINPYPEAGVWKLTLTLTDQSGNSRTYTPSDLANLGLNTDLTVAGGISDTQAPILTSVSLEKTSVNTATNAATNVITTQFTDNLSGMGLSKVQIISPTGGITSTTDLTLNSTVGPNAYTGTMQVEQYAETGVWKIRITGMDNSGNYVLYDTAELTAMGQPTGFTVTGNGDSTPPVVTSFNFDVANPIINEVPFGGGVLSLNAQFSDNLSGFQAAVVKFTSPTGGQVSSNTFYQDGSIWRSNIYLPVYAASGVWVPTLDIYDNAGNVAHLDSTALAALGMNKTFSIAKNVTSAVAVGGTVSSDEENNGATPTDPVEVSITSPVAGNISIVAIDSDQITNQSNGYFFFGRQISINAPTATVADPLTLKFRIDASKVPAGQSASTLQVSKNGSLLPACINSTTADPDACVFARNTLSDGDIEVSIHSTSASVWGSGFPAAPRSTPVPSYTFKNFLSPIKKSPNINVVESEDSLPIKFNLGDYYGLNVIEAGYPKSQKINCTTFAPIGGSTPTIAVSGNGLKYKDGKGIYRYEWRTLESWENTCRQFVLKLTNGSVETLYFKFKD